MDEILTHERAAHIKHTRGDDVDDDAPVASNLGAYLEKALCERAKARTEEVKQAQGTTMSTSISTSMSSTLFTSMSTSMSATFDPFYPPDQGGIAAVISLGQKEKRDAVRPVSAQSRPQKGKKKTEGKTKVFDFVAIHSII